MSKFNEIKILNKEKIDLIIKLMI